MSLLIKATLSEAYKNKISSEEAVSTLATHLTKEQLAEYIVDAFDRGWITKFNIGLDSDGNVL